jgi:hypothetical protein
VPTVPLIRVGNETERRFQSVVLEIAAKMWSDLLAT